MCHTTTRIFVSQVHCKHTLKIILYNEHFTQWLGLVSQRQQWNTTHTKATTWTKEGWATANTDNLFNVSPTILSHLTTADSSYNVFPLAHTSFQFTMPCSMNRHQILITMLQLSKLLLCDKSWLSVACKTYKID